MHRMLLWLSENVFPAWKATSIVFTGAFGILGLVRNFKTKVLDKESDLYVEKITKWGWVSLVGILVSTAMGVAAQIRDSHEDAKRTLVLAKQSQETLNEIKKVLSPIDITGIALTFEVDCNNRTFSDFCAHAGFESDAHGHMVPDWKGWPTDQDGTRNVDAILRFFRAGKTVKDLASSMQPADLSFLVNLINTKTKGRTIWPDQMPYSKDPMTIVSVDARAPKGNEMSSTGGIRSIDELRKSTLVIYVPPLEWGSGLKLPRVSIHFANGEAIISDPSYESFSVRFAMVFVVHFDQNGGRRF